MISIILVSHSSKITEGLKEMIEEMTGKHENIKIFSCGGIDSERLGTDPMFILSTIESVSKSERIYLFGDIGSAILSIHSVLELIEDEHLKEKCHYIDGPLVEGAFVASVQCMVDSSLEAVEREVNQVKSHSN